MHMQLINARVPREVTATVTRRGQITIPAEVRRLLGTKPKSKVTFRISGSQVRLIPTRFTLESVFGSVRSHRRPEDFEKLEQQVREDRVEHTLRGLAGE